MYPTLEEEAAPAPERTQDWIHVSKFEDSRKEDLQQDYIEQKVSKSVMYDEASGQPPDYSQTMRMQQIIPQQTNQYQHGYQIGGLDLGQQQLSGASRNTLTQQYNTMSQLNGHCVGFAPTITQPLPQALGRMNCTERESIKSQKAEEMKRKLRKRGIPE